VRKRIAEIDRLFRKLGLQILVPEASEAEAGVARFLASPDELERFLDRVAPGGEAELERFGWTLRADPVDVAAGEGPANWVTVIALEVPVEGLGEFARALRERIGADGDVEPSVLVDGSDTPQ